MAKPEILRRIEGSILGCAIGDALARQDKQQIQGEAGKVLNQVWVTDLALKNHYTGSTETAIKVAEVLSVNLLDDESQILENIALNLVVWLSDFRETSIPSDATVEGIKKILMGYTHFESWSDTAKDASPIVRSIPIGLAYYEKPAKMKTLAVNQAAITHKNEAAIVCSEIVGLFISWAMLGITPAAYIENIFKYYDRLNDGWEEYLAGINKIRPDSVKLDKEFFINGWTTVLKALEKVTNCLEETPFDVHKKLGKGWLAEEALANALYCLMKSPDDFSQVVITAVNVKGQRNYIASVAGAIAGAYLKIDAIPENWRNKIEFKGKLFDTAGLLFLGLIE